MYQLNQHIENQCSTAIGSLRFELPPVADYTDAPPAVKYQIQFPPSRLAISHSSIIEPQTKTNNNYKDISIQTSPNINSNSKLLCQTPPHHHPITQKSKDSGSADSGIWTIAESANIKSQSLLFNPRCDNNSNFNFNYNSNSNSNSNSNYNYNSILLQLQLQLLSSSPLVIQVLEYILRSFIPLIEPEPPPIPEHPSNKCLYGGSNSMGHMHHFIEPLSDHEPIQMTEYSNRNCQSVVS